MSNYAKATNFTVKDTLESGNPAKIIKGGEIDTELDNIQTAVNSKADKNSPSFSGSITADNLTVTGVLTAAVIDGGSF